MKPLYQSIVIIVFALFINVQAQAVQVALELNLLIDTSNSIDSAEFLVQKNGYILAFQDQRVLDAIAAVGDIAVSVSYFSTTATPGPTLDTDPTVMNPIANAMNPQIGWTLVNSSNVSSFVTLLNGLNPTDEDDGSGAGETNIADAIRFGRLGFQDNGFEGGRLAIDLSTDGVQNLDTDATSNACATTSPTYCTNFVIDERDAAANAGININALAINPDDIVLEIPPQIIDMVLMDLGLPTLAEGAGIDDYLAAFVITGQNSFVEVAEFNDASGFADALARKIALEINPIPIPAAFWLFGSALGFLLVRQKSKNIL